MAEITLSTKQIINLCKFAGLEINKKESGFEGIPEELETEFRISQNEYGAIAWLDEYPEEGGYPLSDNLKDIEEA